MSSSALADPSRQRTGTLYAHLLERVRGAGLLERRHGFYISRISLMATLFAGGWVAFAFIGDSWWQLATATLLGFVFTQLGFLGHDAGHRQITNSRRISYVLGLLHGNLAIGLSYGWWVDKHVRHHAHPNQEGADPDIDLGAFAFSAEQAGGRGRFAAFVYRYQAFFFFPLTLLEGLSLHVASIRALLRRSGRPRVWEAVLLAVHLAAYLSAVFLVLSPGRAIAFIAVQQGLFGLYLGCSFAPNHKGMAMLSAGERADFLSRQVLTSRNVRPHWLTDFMLGGLNYQIEHHLFPSMPRPNLRKAQKIVENFCREHGVPYVMTGPFESYAQVLRHLHSVGNPTPA